MGLTGSGFDSGCMPVDVATRPVVTTMSDTSSGEVWPGVVTGVKVADMVLITHVKPVLFVDSLVGVGTVTIRGAPVRAASARTLALVL